MFDLHVHSAPCLLPRLADDAETVAFYEAAGFRGCVLKSHFEPTAGRARAARAGRRPAVYGGIVLNSAVGGLNPDAVEASLALGARVVWMPTIDSHAHVDAGLPRPHGAAPVGALPPVTSANETAVRRILDLVSAADAVLATGHLSPAEIGWLVPAALQAGVRRVLITHASFTVPALDASATRSLVALGAKAEVTAFQLLHQEGASGARLAAFIRAVGPEHCVLSSDAGQPDSPPAPEALLRLAETLVSEGLERGDVEAMASELPEALVTV